MWASPISEAGPVMDGVFWACTFHLFRLRLGRALLPVEGDVCCAAPNDFVVPGFIDENWAFEGTFSLYNAPDGFEPPSAAAAVRRQGYYVFMAYSGPLAASPSLPEPLGRMNEGTVHPYSAASRKTSALQSTSQS